MQDRSTPLARLLIDIQDALHQLKESIGKYQKTERKNRRDTIRFWLEIVGVLAAVALAILTLLTLRTFNGQLNEMRRTNADTERQFREQQRPWLGLSGSVGFPKQPVFQVFTTRTPANTAIDISVVFAMKNFGVSPAFEAASDIQIKLTGNTLAPPEFEMTGACSIADSDSKSGSVIFPSGEITTNFETVFGQTIDLTSVRRVWILGCIAYHDETADAMRHTRFWIVSYMIPENSARTVNREPRGNEIVTFYSLPISGWNMVKTEAD